MKSLRQYCQPDARMVAITILAVATALTLPQRAEAGCGDYLVVLGPQGHSNLEQFEEHAPQVELNRGTKFSTGYVSTVDYSGPKKPCHGPGCGQTPPVEPQGMSMLPTGHRPETWPSELVFEKLVGDEVVPVLYFALHECVFIEDAPIAGLLRPPRRFGFLGCAASLLAC